MEKKVSGIFFGNEAVNKMNHPNKFQMLIKQGNHVEPCKGDLMKPVTRYQNRRYIVPSLSIIRDVLIRVDPMHLDHALQCWNQAYAQQDESLAIDGKTMCNAIDDQGYQTHIMSAIGHQSKTCYTQKKSTPSL